MNCVPSSYIAGVYVYYCVVSLTMFCVYILCAHVHSIICSSHIPIHYIYAPFNVNTVYIYAYNIIKQKENKDYTDLNCLYNISSIKA